MEILVSPWTACAVALARASLGLALVCVAAPSQHARAQGAVASAQRPMDAETRAIFDAGQTAFAAHRFEAALDAFERAHARSGRPAMLFNIGVTAERLGRTREALVAYEGYVAALPNAPNRRAVAARIVALRQVLGGSARAAPAPSAAREPSAVPHTPATRPSPTDPAEAQAPRDLPPVQGVASGGEPLAPAESLGDSLDRDGVDRNPRDANAARVGGAVATGVVLAGVGTALVTLAARDRRSVEGADVGTSWDTVSDDYDRAPRRAAIGMTLIGAGAAAAITGVALAIANRPGRGEHGARSARRTGFDGTVARERVEVSAWTRF